MKPKRKYHRRRRMTRAEYMLRHGMSETPAKMVQTYSKLEKGYKAAKKVYRKSKPVLESSAAIIKEISRRANRSSQEKALNL